MIRLISAIFLTLLLAAPSLAADVAAPKLLTDQGCARYTLCSAEADVTDACDDGSGNNYVADFEGVEYTGTAYATSSSATTFTCGIYSGDNGYHATKRITLYENLTATQWGVSLEGVFKDVWASCVTSIAGGTVTIYYYVCPIER